MKLATAITQTHIDEFGILTITLNRPDKFNALNTDVLYELDAIFIEAKFNSAIKGILLTGQGKAFCAGADINKLLELDANQGAAFAEHGQAVLRNLETCGKPVVAAINGFCFGGGCELAMAAHIRIASETALFGQPEVKLGVIPGYGGTQRLARLVGKGRAIDLCITGRSIDAPTALTWGLITDITSGELLIETARSLLLSILKNGPMAVRLATEVIDRGFDLSLPDALAIEAQSFGLGCASSEKQEGVSAFLEKRAANFELNSDQAPTKDQSVE